MVGGGDHGVHAAQIDNDTLAQGAPGPIMATAAHRQWQITFACSPDGPRHVLWSPAMDDGARHAPDRLWPDCCRGGISVGARPRYAARELAAEAAECSFDQIGHVLLLPATTGTRPFPRLNGDLGRSERLFVKIPAVWSLVRRPAG